MLRWIPRLFLIALVIAESRQASGNEAPRKGKAGSTTKSPGAVNAGKEASPRLIDEETTEHSDASQLKETASNMTSSLKNVHQGAGKNEKQKVVAVGAKPSNDQAKLKTVAAGAKPSNDEAKQKTVAKGVNLRNDQAKQKTVAERAKPVNNQAKQKTVAKRPKLRNDQVKKRTVAEGAKLRNDQVKKRTVNGGANLSNVKEAQEPIAEGEKSVKNEMNSTSTEEEKSSSDQEAGRLTRKKSNRTTKDELKMISLENLAVSLKVLLELRALGGVPVPNFNAFENELLSHTMNLGSLFDQAMQDDININQNRKLIDIKSKRTQFSDQIPKIGAGLFTPGTQKSYPDIDLSEESPYRPRRQTRYYYPYGFPTYIPPQGSWVEDYPDSPEETLYEKWWRSKLSQIKAEYPPPIYGIYPPYRVPKKPLNNLSTMFDPDIFGLLLQKQIEERVKNQIQLVRHQVLNGMNAVMGPFENQQDAIKQTVHIPSIPTIPDAPIFAELPKHPIHPKPYSASVHNATGNYNININ